MVQRPATAEEGSRLGSLRDTPFNSVAMDAQRQMSHV